MTKNEGHPLERDIKAFEEKRTELEKAYLGKFVVFQNGRLVGAWDTLDAAATEAVRQFGRGPYLIRRVGAATPTLPASVLFRKSVA